MQPQPEKIERRPVSQAELQLLADAWRREFPELWHKQPGDVLTRWRRIADRHRLYVEYTRPKKDKQDDATNDAKTPGDSAQARSE